jgi:hypothetical protein
VLAYDDGGLIDVKEQIILVRLKIADYIFLQRKVDAWVVVVFVVNEYHIRMVLVIQI